MADLITSCPDTDNAQCPLQSLAQLRGQPTQPVQLCPGVPMRPTLRFKLDAQDPCTVLGGQKRIE